MMKQHFLIHNDICALIYLGNISGAKKLFRSRFCSVQEEHTSKETRFFLSSLNLGIYHYILSRKNASLESVCLDNQKLLENCDSTSNAFCDMGLKIIHSYAHCKEYFFERYENPHIRKVIHYIQTNLAEEICLETLGNFVGLSKQYLVNLFKKETGGTIHDYLAVERLKAARTLLQNSDMSVETISEACGFNTPSYFCTFFKQKVGTSPLQFRKQQPSLAG